MFIIVDDKRKRYCIECKKVKDEAGYLFFDSIETLKDYKQKLYDLKDNNIYFRCDNCCKDFWWYP